MSNNGSNDYVSTVALLQTFYFTLKSVISSAGFFHENLVIMTCCTLGNLEIRTLKPNRFKNQSSNILKLLDQNRNHQQGFIKQKIITLHHGGFKLKSLKHCYLL